MWVQNIVQEEACPVCGTRASSNSSRSGAPYISMCGLRAGQNHLHSVTAEAPRGSRSNRSQGYSRSSRVQNRRLRRRDSATSSRRARLKSNFGSRDARPLMFDTVAYPGAP